MGRMSQLYIFLKEWTRCQCEHLGARVDQYCVLQPVNNSRYNQLRSTIILSWFRFALNLQTFFLVMPQVTG